MPTWVRQLRVEPLVLPAVVVLARVQLTLVIRIVATERINEMIVVDSGEERLIARHLSQNLDSFVVVEQMRMLVAIGAQTVN